MVCVITLPRDQVRVAQLQAKLVEYRGRLARACQNEDRRRAVGALCKSAVLDVLLRDGRVVTEEVRAALAERHGEDFDPYGCFENACSVLEDYCLTGGMNVIGGTGLPLPQLPK